MTYLKSFYYIYEQILVPAGTKIVYEGNGWALYHNDLPSENFTLIVTKGKQNGIDGWRVRQFSGLMKFKEADNFVKTHCGGCLGHNNE